MEENRDFEIVGSAQAGLKINTLARPDPAATPFKTLIDPKLRLELRRALIDLLDYHDEALVEKFRHGWGIGCQPVGKTGILPVALLLSVRRSAELTAFQRCQIAY